MSECFERNQNLDKVSFEFDFNMKNSQNKINDQDNDRIKIESELLDQHQHENESIERFNCLDDDFNYFKALNSVLENIRKANAQREYLEQIDS